MSGASRSPSTGSYAHVGSVGCLYENEPELVAMIDIDPYANPTGGGTAHWLVQVRTQVLQWGRWASHFWFKGRGAEVSDAT